VNNLKTQPTLDTRCDCLGVVVKDKTMKYKEYTNFYVIPRGSDGKLINGSYNRVWKEEKYVGALNVTKIQEVGKMENNNLRIRKLTPKECWRLMGFDDKDFEKVAQVNTNAQLYKQAGNSIVVNVLEAILNNLLKSK
jgi:DNA (cytosine-5)-methyltransferase 1